MSTLSVPAKPRRPSTHELIARQLLEAIGFGAVVVSRPVISADRVLLTDIAVACSNDTLAPRLARHAAQATFPRASLARPTRALTRRFAETQRDTPATLRLEAIASGRELQWMVFDPVSREVCAWICVLEVPSEGGLRRDAHRRLGQSRASIRRALSPAAVLEIDDSLPAGFVRVDRAQARVDGSAELLDWIAGPDVRAGLLNLVEHADGPIESSLKGATLSCAPLSGAPHVWVGTVRANRPLVLTPQSLLTPTQRRVAEYAAAGATCSEIARTLEASIETIRSHLKAIYRSLDICCRAELAQLIMGAEMTAATL